MINLKQLAKFLNYCGIDDSERRFGVINHDSFPEYINVNAALLDAVSSTDDSIVASTALAYIKNMSDIDTSSITQESLHLVVEKLFKNALASECVLNYVVLYLYTTDENVLEILMTFTDLTFHDAVLLLLAADIVPHNKRSDYVNLAIAHMEYGLLHGLYSVEEMPDSLAVLYCHSDYINVSKLLKKLLKLFSIVPSANNYLTRVGFSLRDLLYISLSLYAYSSFSDIEKSHTRLAGKFFAVSVASEDVLPLYIKELFSNMLPKYNYYSIQSNYKSEGAICNNFDNLKWLLDVRVPGAMISFPVFDVYHYVWTKCLLHRAPEIFAQLLLSQIDNTPAEVVKSLMMTLPAVWVYLQSVQAYTLVSLCRAFAKYNVFTMSEMISCISEEQLLYMVETDPKYLTEYIETIFARELSEEIRIKLVYLYCTQKLESVSVKLLQDYEKYIFPYIYIAETASLRETPYYLEHRLTSFLVNFNCCVADNLIADMHVKTGEKRKYGRSVLNFLKAAEYEVPDSVYRLAYTEKEYMAFSRSSFYKLRLKVGEEISTVPNAAMLSKWIINNESADYAYDIILSKVHDVFSESSSTRDIATFIGSCYDSLNSLHIDPDELLDELRQRKGDICWKH